MPSVFLNGGGLDRRHEVPELLDEIEVEGMKFRPQLVDGRVHEWMPGVPYYLYWWEPAQPSGRPVKHHTTGPAEW